MDRRQFLQGSFGAALAAPFVTARAAGQNPPPPPTIPVPVTTRLILDANSRQLQWMRTPDELAEAAVELACGGVCLNVGPAPAHIDMAGVRQQLPMFVGRIKAAGLRVAQVKGPNITNPDDPNVDRSSVRPRKQAARTTRSAHSPTIRPGPSSRSSTRSNRASNGSCG